MKDAYYFPHFSNARNDRKIKRVIKTLGVEGYGIYFMLLEVLRDQGEFKYPLSDVDLLADEFNTSEAKVNAVIKSFDLFNIDEDQMFFSVNLIKYLEPMFKMREQRIEAGKASGRARSLKAKTNDRSTTVQRAMNENEQSKGKESKEKESKLNESIGKQINAPASDFINLPIADTDPELIQFFTDYGSTAQEASSFYNHYHSQGWLKSNGIPVTNWQSIARKWIDRERFGTQPYKSKPKSIGEIMSGYNL